MKQVRRIFSSRLIASGFALTLTSFALMSIPAQAQLPLDPTENGCQGIGSVTTYYANGRQAVGHYIHWCNGVCEGSGTITSDFDVAYLMCANPGGGEP